MLPAREYTQRILHEQHEDHMVAQSIDRETQCYSFEKQTDVSAIPMGLESAR